MLAIFDGRVAKRPECMMFPERNAVSSLKDDFLVNHFTSLYPDSVVIRSAAFAFAYSPDDNPNRFHFAHSDGIFCLFQGFIEDIEAVKQELNLTEINDAAILAIRAFQTLRQSPHRVPLKEVEDMAENGISVLYESTSKLVILASGSYWDLPVYWGIDARFNLVISSNDTVVQKACSSVRPFTSGHVYACCDGRWGDEALYPYKQPEFKVVLTDKSIPAQQSIDSIDAMIRKADMNKSKPPKDKWEPPPPNLVKINTDGVLFNTGMIGIGVVIRNYNGEVEFAVTRRKHNELPGLDPVVHAFMEGLHLTEELCKVSRCISESVHLDIEKHEDTIGWVPMGVLIEKAGTLVVKNLSEFGVSFVSSGANKAAHRLALHAKEECYVVWTKETPECIARIVESERPTCGCTIS